MHPITKRTLHECIIMLALLTCRVEKIFHHMNHTICRHQVTVRHIHRIDMNGVVYLEKKRENISISTFKDLNRRILYLYCELLELLKIKYCLEIYVPIHLDFETV